MNIKEAVNIITNHQKAHLKQRSLYSYSYVLKRFEQQYGDRMVESINSEEIYQFLEDLTGSSAKATQR